MSDWQFDQQSSRRFPHKSQTARKAHGRHGGDSQSGSFQTRNMLGRFTVRSAVLQKLVTERLGAKDTGELYVEIHELVATETAYLASFNFGVVAGIMLIAGSRKSLAAAVGQEDVADDDNKDSEQEESDEEDDPDTATDDEGRQDSEQGQDEEDVADGTSFLTASSLERPSHAFEKNTFRAPKWFAQWRGRVIKDPHKGHTDRGVSEVDDELDEDMPGHNTHKKTGTEDRGHFEFTSSACHEFKATFSCSDLGLKECPLHGWKLTGKATPAVQRWSELKT